MMKIRIALSLNISKYILATLYMSIELDNFAEEVALLTEKKLKKS